MQFFLTRLYREEELAALVRDKRAADSNFRKVKLALEGPPPKKPAPKKKDDKEDKKKDDKDENKESDVTKEKPFKATATKKQLVSIKRVTCLKSFLEPN